MSQFTSISSRQRRIISILLEKEGGLTYSEIAGELNMSVRTAQREVKQVKLALSSYGLKLVKKMGGGLTLKGSPDSIDLLKKQLEEAFIYDVFSPRERQEGIVFDLLLATEPVKLYVLSKKYSVTEGTVSHDLDKASLWLEQMRLKLIRKPGLGVYIEGTDQQKRMACSRFLLEGTTFEEWIHLFYLPEQEKELTFYHRLHKYVDMTDILKVEKAVRGIINEENMSFNDRNYVNLIIHIMLAVERIKHGENFEEETDVPEFIFNMPEYKVSEKIVTQVEDVLNIVIPKLETSYIALHLSGRRYQKDIPASGEDIKWTDFTNRFIKAVEDELGEMLRDDEILFEGLISHFIPAMNRLELGLQIHNPMAGQIKEQHPVVYAACCSSMERLSGQIDHRIPDDEIGYLAMHVEAALMRQKEMKTGMYRGVVVCASGMGTSTYLKTRLKQEIANLDIVGVVSAIELTDWLESNTELDLIISTVNIPNIQQQNTVIVSPFLTREDRQEIFTKLNHLQRKSTPQSINQTSGMNNEQSSSMIQVARYGEAIAQILDHLQVIQLENCDHPIIDNLVLSLPESTAVVNRQVFTESLKQREKQGGFVLGNLAMLHAKTSGVDRLLVAVFRVKSPFNWKGEDGTKTDIHSVLLLGVPLSAPKEHVTMTSQISATLIEDDFINALHNHSYEEVYRAIESVLTEVYLSKTREKVKELKSS